MNPGLRIPEEMQQRKPLPVAMHFPRLLRVLGVSLCREQLAALRLAD